MKTKYKVRIADALLSRKLEGKGAVLIEGAKWCGKTTTAEQQAQSIVYMTDPEKSYQYLSMVELNPKTLLAGETPRLFDEWQIAPKLWDAIRFEVDHRDDLGQFILTGSAVPPETWRWAKLPPPCLPFRLRRSWTKTQPSSCSNFVREKP